MEKGFAHFLSVATIALVGIGLFFVVRNFENPTSFFSKAASSCPAGQFSINACYSDGTPQEIKLLWNSPVYEGQGCKIYISGADPGESELVSSDCGNNQKVFKFSEDRIFGNALGSEDIYELGIQNGDPACSDKTVVAPLNVEEVCNSKKTAGSKPQPPSQTTNYSKKIQDDFNIPIKGFTNGQSRIAYSALVDYSKNSKLIDLLAKYSEKFSLQSGLLDDDNCSLSTGTPPQGSNEAQTRVWFLDKYLRFIEKCLNSPQKLEREHFNLWDDYGGLTPATANPDARKNPQTVPNNCQSPAVTSRTTNPDIARYWDYQAMLGSYLDRDFLKLMQSNFCASNWPYEGNNNPRHCQLAERILKKDGTPSICGTIPSDTLSASPYGIQIDTTSSNKMPSTLVIQELKPSWVRFVYRGGDLPILPGVSKIAIFNEESFRPTIAPQTISPTDQTSWNNYINNSQRSYIESLQAFLDKNKSSGANQRVQAIEIWNEPDLGVKVPPASYASMLKQSANLIKSKDPNIKVIAAGLASDNWLNYINGVKNADPNVFQNVDVVSIHPYGRTPNEIKSQISQLRQATGKPVWITEIGQSFGTNPNEQNTQGSYLQEVFQAAKQANIPVVIWYSWTDVMKGPDPEDGWGLYDTSGKLKPSGQFFKQFTNL